MEDDSTFYSLPLIEVSGTVSSSFLAASSTFFASGVAAGPVDLKRCGVLNVMGKFDIDARQVLSFLYSQLNNGSAVLIRLVEEFYTDKGNALTGWESGFRNGCASQLSSKCGKLFLLCLLCLRLLL